MRSQGANHVGSGTPPAEHQRPPFRLLGSLALTLAAFFVLRSALGNATTALAITDGIPLLWLVAVGLLHRRLERLALIPVVVFTVALVASIAFGGSALPLELRRSVFPGAVGLACLISLAIRRPLLLEAATRVPRPGQLADAENLLERPGSRRALTVLTAIAGVTGLADAIAQVVLALTLSTSQFVAAAHVASYVIIGGGLLVAVVYVRWTRARLQHRH